jgi:hypothetical protein
MSLAHAYEHRNAASALALLAPPPWPPHRTPTAITAPPLAVGATGAQPVSSSAPSCPFKRLTLAKMGNRRKLDQCYNCDEPYVTATSAYIYFTWRCLTMWLRNPRRTRNLSRNRPNYKSTSPKTITEVIKFSNLSPYNSGSPRNHEGFQTKPRATKIVVIQHNTTLVTTGHK